MIMRLKDCHNFGDFRKLAKLKLPSPIFHYIDGAADDEITYARNTSAFDDVDLVPNVLKGFKEIKHITICPRIFISQTCIGQMII